MSGNYLSNNIPNLILHFLLSTEKPLPQIITDTTALEEHSERALLCAQGHDAFDVFDGATQESGFQDTVRHGRGEFLAVGVLAGVIAGGRVEV